MRVATNQANRRYEGVTRKESLKPIEPMWSKEPLTERFIRSLDDMFIGDDSHPIVKRLRGEEGEEQSEES